MGRISSFLYRILAGPKRLEPVVDVGLDREQADIQAGYDVLHKEHDNDHWKYATNKAFSALDTYDVRQGIARLA